MPKTPDRHPDSGAEDQEGVVYRDVGSLSVAEGEVRYNGGRFSFYDSTGEYDPRSGSGISEAQHETLDTLVHRLSETSYVEVTRSGNDITDIVVWTDNSKTTKIRETNITRSGGKVSQVVEKQYDGSGVLVQTLTSSITRTSGRVSSIDVTES